MFKSGYAVIVGRPNVGKSTLMNHLIGQKIAITSNRPQTTRGRIETVYTNERGQIIFLDTPGMIRKADNKLGEYLIDVSNKTIGDADVVLWLIEPSSYIGKGDRMIAEKLTKSGKPVILIINKIDTIDKKKAAEIIEAWKGVCRFKDIIAVSALRSVNMDEVINSIMRELPEGPLYYDEETVTQENMRDIAAEIIREKALRHLRDEVPHGIGVEILGIEKVRDDLTEINATIYCERDAHKGIIIGKHGAMLQTIGTEARLDIERLLDTHINLKLWVKIRPDWRNNASDLKTLGYEDK